MVRDDWDIDNVREGAYEYRSRRKAMILAGFSAGERAVAWRFWFVREGIGITQASADGSFHLGFPGSRERYGVCPGTLCASSMFCARSSRTAIDALT